MASWTVEQLFDVMLAPAELEEGYTRAHRDEQIAELRPALLRHFAYALGGVPLNDEALEFAAIRDADTGLVKAFRSTYFTDDEPDTVKNTVLTISADSTRSPRGPLFVRDDLFEPRLPSGGFIRYISKLSELRLEPMKRLIKKNRKDVGKALTAMAYVQQINVALQFAEDFSLYDRSRVWVDLFDTVDPLPLRYKLMTRQELEQLFWRGDEHCEECLNHVQIKRLKDFRKNQVDPLIEQLGRAAAWAQAGATEGVEPCASARVRDLAAKRLLRILRMDDVVLDALRDWDNLHLVEQQMLSQFFEAVLDVLSQCPGATTELLRSEFLAVARGAAKLVDTVPDLPSGSSHEAMLAEAVSRFDPDAELVERPTDLTKVIRGAFDNYDTARKLPAPIISLWAHSTPAILARFDKKTPHRVNIKGSAYLLRSIFGMGLLDEREMEALYTDLAGVVNAAVEHGAGHSKTKRRLRQLFSVELSHGKYPVRSNAWSDSRLFNSIKVAVGVLGIRQSFISAADDKTLPQEAFIEFADGVLTAVGGAMGLRAALRDISGAGEFAIRRAPSFLDKLPAASKLARVAELVSVVSKYQAVQKTDPSSLARDHANADLAVAWLTVIIAIYETALATTFPVAALALIVLRWGLFHEDLWNAIGGVKSATPMVKVVNGILDQVESGEIGALLKKAPNWGKVKGGIEKVRAAAPVSIGEDEVNRHSLYFHIQTGHASVLRDLAVYSYRLPPDIAEMLIED
ncbi:MAG: hypothetical protein ACE37F_21025 [Nannocystaceae bacterium]